MISIIKQKEHLKKQLFYTQYYASFISYDHFICFYFIAFLTEWESQSPRRYKGIHLLFLMVFLLLILLGFFLFSPKQKELTFAKISETFVLLEGCVTFEQKESPPNSHYICLSHTLSQCVYVCVHMCVNLHYLKVNNFYLCCILRVCPHDHTSKNEHWKFECLQGVLLYQSCEWLDTRKSIWV